MESGTITTPRCVAGCVCNDMPIVPALIKIKSRIDPGQVVGLRAEEAKLITPDLAEEFEYVIRLAALSTEKRCHPYEVWDPPERSPAFLCELFNPDARGKDVCVNPKSGMLMSECSRVSVPATFGT